MIMKADFSWGLEVQTFVSILRQLPVEAKVQIDKRGKVG
jgi:hypothetical protein